MENIQEQRKERVLIIGAGIAGLSLAVQLLTHAKEFYDVVLFEKATSLDDISKSGFVINLSPNAISILKDLDFDLVKEKIGMPLNRTVLHHASFPKEILAQSDDIFDDMQTLLTVERGPLQLLLLERFRSLGGRIHLGKRLIAIHSSDETKISAEFASGDIFVGTLLVGADGVHSSVRKHLYSNLSSKDYLDAKPNYCPFTSTFPFRFLNTLVSAVIRLSGINGNDNQEALWEAKPTRWTALYGITKPLTEDLFSGGENGENGFGTMHWYIRDVPGAYSTYALHGNRVFWICYQSEPLPNRELRRETSSPAPWRRYTDPEARETMDSYARLPYSPQIPQDPTTSPVPFQRITELSERVMKVRLWHTLFPKIINAQGTLILIGDSAHPMTSFHGQGGGIAIEEGLVLCNGLLRKAWKDRRQGLRFRIPESMVGIHYFDSQRRGRSQRVTDLGWWFGLAVMGDWWGLRKIRDVLFRWVLPKMSAVPKETVVVVERPTASEDQQPLLSDDNFKGDIEGLGVVEREGPELAEHWLFDLKLKIETKEEFWKVIESGGYR